jgi:CBS domain-containing protein
MGDKRVNKECSEAELRRFTTAILNDIHALEKMLEQGMFEEGVRRIGAEQEMFLVDSAMRPAPLAMEVIEKANDPRLTTEIGRFNLEANITPQLFSGDCFSRMEDELNDVVDVTRSAVSDFGGDVVLAGILPTIQSSDLTESNLTPNPRYAEINRVVTKLHGENRVIHIKGRDELQLTLQDTFVEFCNTSFQVHLQVDARDFVNTYNWAQAIAAPVLAAAANSPLLLNHKLWHETRISLFQLATDTRSLAHQARSQPPRVNFGECWLKESVVELLRADAIRFRILLTQAVEENSLEVLEAGGIPQLAALRLHNGTIWRWNRPCFGVMDGKAGLRIEARYLPAGPTVADEMANAAFLLGLLTALPEEFEDVAGSMSFDDARNNFFNVARYGLDTQINGLDGKKRKAGRLILEELLPRARAGLETSQIQKSDIDRYLGIIEERVKTARTGALWMLDSLDAMDPRAKHNVRMRTLTEAMKVNQKKGGPVHTWDLATIAGSRSWIDNYSTVEQFMSTDLFTVRPEDVIDLAASLMHWRHVRHVPVENDDGELVGLVSHRDLLEMFVEKRTSDDDPIPVRALMKTNLITITPETDTLRALRMMRELNIGCLPVVREKKLIGLITAHDFLTVSAKLLEEKLIALAMSRSDKGAFYEYRAKAKAA